MSEHRQQVILFSFYSVLTTFFSLMLLIGLKACISVSCLFCCNILCGWQDNLLLCFYIAQLILVEMGNSCKSGIVGVDSSLRDGCVLQSLPCLNLLLQTIVNLVVGHFLCLVCTGRGLLARRSDESESPC